jgi:hypothetical protein
MLDSDWLLLLLLKELIELLLLLGGVGLEGVASVVMSN